MALGKAVVSTNIGAEGIEADPETQIAIADEPISFAYQIINLLNDRRKLEKMGENAKLFARIKLDNNRITKALLDFYSEML
jgi:glycosyltransferase involved in cell wall biosynthesis